MSSLFQPISSCCLSLGDHLQTEGTAQGPGSERGVHSLAMVCTLPGLGGFVLLTTDQAHAVLQSPASRALQAAREGASSNLFSNGQAGEETDVDIYCQWITTCEIHVRVFRKWGGKLWKGLKAEC